MDGSRYAVVWAWEDGENVIVRSLVTNSPSRAWTAIADRTPRLLLLPPQLHVHYRGRVRTVMVGASEMGRYMTGVGRAIADRQIRHHPDDHGLNDDLGRAVAATTEAGIRLSIRRSPGPIEVARAMVWAVGHVLKPGKPKPRIRVVQ